MQPVAASLTLPQAYQVIKEFELREEEWSSDYRKATSEALREILEERMDRFIDTHLELLSRGDPVEPDRRNGYYRRHLLTELGDVELSIPRTRTISAISVLRLYARRSAHVDRLILACFVLGLSTRKVAQALLPILGEPVSASTVSRVARTLDAAVAAFHRRPLRDAYRVLVFDGVVLARKTGAGALRRPVLVALGLHADGRKEIIDYRLAASESQAEWEMFISDLHRRGLEGESLRLIGLDGGKGLLAALPTVYPGIPVQRCWAHKTRNLTDRVRRADHEAVKKDLHKISHAKNRRAARSAARAFADRWQETYPNVVHSLRGDLDDLLAFFAFDDAEWRKATRTTNAIERRFREVRRRTRPMGVFSDKTSMDRILFAVFMQENKSQGINAPFLLTQNS
jgi:putative transposase